MESAVTHLLAKQEIVEVLYRIARGTDRGDVELYSSGFHDDATYYHGLANGHMSKIANNLAGAKLLLTQHMISNPLIELDDDLAHVEALFSSFHQSWDGDGKLVDEHLRGRYLDRFERRDDGPWKIARRVVVWDWSRVEPAAETWFDVVRARPGSDDRFIVGRRDRADMVFTQTLPAGFEE